MAAARPPGAVSPTPRGPSSERRPPNVLGIVIIATAALVAVLVTVAIFLPALGALGSLGAAATGDPSALPDRIAVCDRTWARDAIARTFTRDEVLARTDAPPVIVEPGPSPSCPPEAAAAGGDADMAAAVVWVQVGDDAFVAYEPAEQP